MINHNKLAQALGLLEPAHMQLGSWRSIQLCLDKAAGELINIGVLLEVDGEKNWRLLEDTQGIKAIYGAAGESNVKFLLRQVEEILKNDQSFPLNWNVRLGPSLFANCHDIESLTQSLYKRVVSVSRFTQETVSRDVDSSLGTTELRRRVRSIIKSKYQNEIPDFWQDYPIKLEGSDGRESSLDLQIWTPADHYSKGFAACVSSAWYKSKFYRESSLNSSFKTLSEAKQLKQTKKLKLGMYILRPFSDPGFDDGLLLEIDNEIDSLTWLLKKIDVHADVHDNEESLTAALLAAA